MTFALLRQHRSKVFALATVLWSADSLVTLGATAVTFGCEKEGGLACTQMGCVFPPVTLRIPRATLPMGERLTLTVCRENACLSGEFTLGNADASSPDVAAFTIRDTLTSSFYASVTVSRNSGITIGYTGSYDYSDGDRYTVTIEDANGQELLNKETTVTYTKSYPNGPECGPLCMQADVTL